MEDHLNTITEENISKWQKSAFNCFASSTGSNGHFEIGILGNGNYGVRRNKELIPEERQMCIDAGLTWKDVADLHVFYIDYGISKGMQYAIDYANNDIEIEYRKIL